MTAPGPLVLSDHANVALLAAELVSNRLRAKPSLRLLLPTGHTPLGMYAALRAHAADGSLPTERATLFQLDEYLGLAPEDPRSYRSYLARELEGVSFGAFHGLDGTTDDPAAESARHQAALDEMPIDLVVLGIGRDGHVAFDEPGSPVDAGVRRVRLHETTRADAAGEFGGIEGVPTEALTVGLRTLRSARELILLVSGETKAAAVAAALEGEPGVDCPASLIRDHPRLTVIADRGAASLLRPGPGRDSDRVLVILGHRERGSAELTISDESRQRVARAVRAARRDPPRAVILTGYTRTGEGLSEAEQMKEEWPLPETPALLEDAGRNTAQNATCSLPLIRAIGGVRRVTVVSSFWHVRALYFFSFYRAFGLRLSFAGEWRGAWLGPLLGELRAVPAMRARRREALAAMRLPADPSRGVP